jgi:hypothetical protein
VQGIAFPGCTVYVQDFSSFAVRRWLEPTNEALPQKTLAAVSALTIHENSDLIQTMLLRFFKLDEPSERANDG